MLVLALDTCDARGSVALLREDSVLQLEPHDAGQDYSSWLIPAVTRVLQAQRVSFPDLSFYAVASGPGSFTGVRVGLTTVKAWSEVHGQPIAPVSRLEALASFASAGTPYIAAFTDARRSQVFAALYRRGDGSLQRIEEEMVIAPSQFADWVIANAGTHRVEWISPDPKCLTSTPQWPSRMALSESIRVVAPVFAAAIGRLGIRAARENRLSNALALDANYVRRSDAELLWKGASGAAKP